MNHLATTPAADARGAIASRHAELLLQAAGVVGFAGLTALAAQIAVPIPGTPVPMTLQSLSVTLAALTLGSRLGSASMALYVLLALVGVPVLAQGNHGVEFVFGATGGYLLGFVLAQPLMARAARNRDGGPAGWRGVVTSLVVGNLAIFIPGVVWLAFQRDLGLSEALSEGLWPFLPGTLVKSGVAFVLGLGLVPWACRRGW